MQVSIIGYRPLGIIVKVYNSLTNLEAFEWHHFLPLLRVYYFHFRLSFASFLWFRFFSFDFIYKNTHAKKLKKYGHWQ